MGNLFIYIKMKFFNTASSALAIMLLLGNSETNAVALKMM